MKEKYNKEEIYNLLYEEVSKMEVTFNESLDITNEQDNCFYPIKHLFIGENNEIGVVFDAGRLEYNKNARKCSINNLPPSDIAKIYKASVLSNVMVENGNLIPKLKDLKACTIRTISAMGNPGQTYKFTDSEAAIIYSRGKWRKIMEVTLPVLPKYSPMVKWRDEDCSQRGANSAMGIGNLPLDTIIEIYELICKKIASSRLQI